MSKKGFRWECAGFLFVSIAGTLCHFIYEWSGYSNLAALFCPVNESPWEHLKLLWFPYLFWSIAEYFALHRPQGYWAPKCAGILCGLAVTTSFFYTYTGIIGKTVLFWDVFSFFLGVFCAFFTDYILIKSEALKQKSAQTAGISIFIILSVLFMIFSFMPPLIPWFRDPKLLTYGV